MCDKADPQPPGVAQQPSELERELSALLNKHSAENGSDTPDFVLARFLMCCLEAFDAAHNRCRQWEAPSQE